MKNIFKNLFATTKIQISAPKQPNYDKPANFETALAATGFGKFNIYLLLIAIPTCWATLFETTTMSYVFPAAQCDLNLSLEDKGKLNAVTFAGTIVSAFLWGILFDKYGRKKLLMIGFLLDGVFVLLSSISQNFTYLMTMKFFGGFIISGPFAALATYFSEMHVAKYRSRIPLIMGVCYAAGGVYLPLLASLVLPLNLKVNAAEGIVFYPWGLFLLINAIPSLLSAAIFIFLPETPKFLMANGQNEEALKVFQKIYSINTGKQKDTFPIKELVKEPEANTPQSISKNNFKNTWEQFKPLFCGSLVKYFILVCSFQLLVTASFNTFRLWLPQLFQAINDYKFFNNGTSSTLCEMLSTLQHKNTPKECFVNFDNFEVYLNSMTICVVSMLGYMIAGSLVNLLGQNKLLCLTSFIASSCGIGIYYSHNSQLATVLIAGYYSLSSIAVNTVLIVIVNLFPTTLRTTAISLSLIFGRGGSVIGNIIFPYMIEIGCGPPFFMLSGLLFVCFILTGLLPRQNKTLI